MSLNISTKFASSFVSDEEIKNLELQALTALKTVQEKSGAGSDF